MSRGLRAADVLVLGSGPAGVAAALRAADLGAATVLITRGRFGGVAAGDGPIAVRTLAHAARLMREARQFRQFGIRIGEPALDYSRLLDHVKQQVAARDGHPDFHAQITAAGVTVVESAGSARFIDPHTVATASGEQFRAGNIIICTGGADRQLAVPGCELTTSHSDVWNLAAVPPSMLVIGGGSTGVQIASTFAEFGTRVQLFLGGARLLPGEDADVSLALEASLREAGILIHPRFGTIQSFHRGSNGIRMRYAAGGRHRSAEAAFAVVALSSAADTAALAPAAAGVATDERGFVRVDAELRTTAPHIFAAGDVTGRSMFVPQAINDGVIAASNAVLGAGISLADPPSPTGSFTNPEYAQVGLTEQKARASHPVLKVVIALDQGAPDQGGSAGSGFCKLLVDRDSRRLLGCHVVGEHAIDIAQLAAMAMTAGMNVDALARIPLSFPSHTGLIGRLAYRAARELDRRQEEPPAANDAEAVVIAREQLLWG